MDIAINYKPLKREKIVLDIDDDWMFTRRRDTLFNYKPVTATKEQAIVNEAQDAIKRFKEKQSAGIGMITISAFFEQLNYQIVQDNEITLNQLDQFTPEQLKQRLDDVNRRVKFIETSEAPFEVQLLEEAMRRKAAKESEKAEIEKQVSQISEKIAEFKAKLDQSDKEFLEWKEKSDQQLTQATNNYDQLSNQAPPGGNTGENQRNRQLITMIDTRLKIIQQAREKEIQFLQDKMANKSELRKLINRLTELNNRKDILQFEINQNIDSRLTITERKKLIIEQLLDDDMYCKYAKFKDRLFINRRVRLVYAVTNLDFSLCEKLVEKFPKFFISWESIVGDKRSIDGIIRRIRNNISSAYTDYNQFESRYFGSNYLNRTDLHDRVVLVPDIKMIDPRFISRTNQNNVWFIDDGLQMDWYNYDQSYQLRMNAATKLNRYILGYELPIFIQINTWHSGSIRYN